MGWRGWLGEDAATDNWGTRMAALPLEGQSNGVLSYVVVVVDVGGLVEVVDPGRLVVVEVVLVVVVPTVAAGGEEPTRSPRATALTPRIETPARHSFEASGRFTSANLLHPRRSTRE